VDLTDFPRTAQLDVDLTVLPEVDSTNTYLRDHPGDPGRVAVAVTDNQTAGRGRQGRTWSLPAGSGLAISVKLPMVSESRWWGAVPLVVGQVVCKVISRETGLTASVKWPNDILVAGKKVSGVLCETQDDFLIAGIGVNLRYPKDALPTPQATSLHMHTVVDGSLPDRLVRGIVTGLIDALDQVDRGHLPQLLGSVAQKIATIGQLVRVDFPDGTSREGTATGLGDDGSLQLVWADGSNGVVVAGDVWHLTALT
jgi:BirA family biotin operon repressor/biotin-[acetyl-CoA-carboxylase] ligase